MNMGRYESNEAFVNVGNTEFMKNLVRDFNENHEAVVEFKKYFGKGAYAQSKSLRSIFWGSQDSDGRSPR